MRPRPYAQPDSCRRCGAPVFTASRDVLGDVVADITADLTVLTPGLQAVCVISGRRRYRYGIEAGRGWLGDAEAYDRKIGAPDVVLPAHVCNQPLPGGQVDVFTGRTVRSPPVWLCQET